MSTLSFGDSFMGVTSLYNRCDILISLHHDKEVVNMFREHNIYYRTLCSAGAYPLYSWYYRGYQPFEMKKTKECQKLRVGGSKIREA